MITPFTLAAWRRYLPALLLAFPGVVWAQTPGVGIGTTTPEASAALDVRSTTQGFLPPRLTTAQRDAIASPAAGLTIFNTTTLALNTWDGSKWVAALADTSPQPVQFSYTGGPQTYTVPTGATTLIIDMAGASGGARYNAGGVFPLGGRVQARLTVTPGQVLTIYVGGAGGYGVAGYNGGGAGGRGTNGVGNAGGGGATDIRLGGTAMSNRVLVAGGAGGAGYSVWGGAGGGLMGGWGAGIGAASGGVQNAGGGGYMPGTLGQGGQGTNDFGGGGGGGYYGGGGGNGGDAGGGGGSSYADATLTWNVAHTQGFQSGNGYVLLAPNTPPATVAAPILDASNFLNMPWKRSDASVRPTNLTDNVGIGTATPTTRLQVVSTDNTLPTNIIDVQANNLTQGVALFFAGLRKTGSNPNGDLMLESKGSGHITLNASGGTGNVGIGIDVPTAKLDVNGDALVRTTLGFGTSNRQMVNLYGVSYGLGVQGGTEYFRSADSFAWFKNGSHSNTQFDPGSGGTTQMVLTSSGNLGVGTTSPTQRLHVAGGVRIEPLSSAGIRMVTADAAGNLNIQAIPTDAQQLSISGNTISLSNGGAVTVPSSADNLGNHTATQALNMNGQAIGFGATVKQMLNLYNTDYGIGVQGGTEYFRTGNAFAWYKLGVHNDNQFDAGSGGTAQMVLTGAGNLGIGTSAPAQRLDVAGSTRTTNAIVTTALTGSGADIGSAVGLGVRADGGLNIGQNTPSNNIYLGYLAGRVNTSGARNLFVGYASGYANTSGSDNQFVGAGSGQSNTSGNYNHFAGYASGISNTSGSFNHFDGFEAGYYATTDSHNHFVGLQSGYHNLGGEYNQFEGFQSGVNNQTGSYNLFTGFQSGGSNTTGNANVFVGYRSGFNNVSGESNTAIGTNSGPAAGVTLTNTTAVGANVQPTQSNTVILGSGANVGIGTTTPAYPLDVNGAVTPGNFTYGYLNSGGAGGNATSTGPISIRASNRVLASEFNATSDRRIKNVIGLSNGAADLALLSRIRITDYTMRDRVAYGERKFKKVIAQEVEEIFPQAVSKHTGFLPDVYALATAATSLGDSLLQLSLPQALPAPAAAGQRLKLIGPQGERTVVLARPATGKVLVVRGANELAQTQVFVFGLEHIDVRTVDYEALAMLNVSATQELLQQLTALQQQTQAQARLLETQQATLQTLQSQASETASLAQRLQALENLLGTRAEATH